jgi:hypothetical protein
MDLFRAFCKSEYFYKRGLTGVQVFCPSGRFVESAQQLSFNRWCQLEWALRNPPKQQGKLADCVALIHPAQAPPSSPLRRDPASCCQCSSRPDDELVGFVPQPLRCAPEGEVDNAAALGVVERRTRPSRANCSRRNSAKLSLATMLRPSFLPGGLNSRRIALTMMPAIQLLFICIFVH